MYMSQAHAMYMNSLHMIGGCKLFMRFAINFGGLLPIKFLVLQVYHEHAMAKLLCPFLRLLVMSGPLQRLRSKSGKGIEWNWSCWKLWHSLEVALWHSLEVVLGTMQRKKRSKGICHYIRNPL